MMKVHLQGLTLAIDQTISTISSCTRAPVAALSIWAICILHTCIQLQLTLIYIYRNIAESNSSLRPFQNDWLLAIKVSL